MAWLWLPFGCGVCLLGLGGLFACWTLFVVLCGCFFYLACQVAGLLAYWVLCFGWITWWVGDLGVVLCFVALVGYIVLGGLVVFGLLVSYLLLC